MVLAIIYHCNTVPVDQSCEQLPFSHCLPVKLLGQRHWFGPIHVPPFSHFVLQTAGNQNNEKNGKICFCLLYCSSIYIFGA